jgi:hypothetical protein
MPGSSGGEKSVRFWLTVTADVAGEIEAHRQSVGLSNSQFLSLAVLYGARYLRSHLGSDELSGFKRSFVAPEVHSVDLEPDDEEEFDYGEGAPYERMSDDDPGYKRFLEGVRSDGRKQGKGSVANSPLGGKAAGGSNQMPRKKRKK